MIIQTWIKETEMVKTINSINEFNFSFILFLLMQQYFNLIYSIGISKNNWIFWIIILIVF